MKLLVIRHGIAMDKDEFAKTGQSDDLRPLTAEGTREMRQVADGLRAEIEKLDLLATSELVRAVQTADIVAAGYELDAPEITTSLAPDTPLEEFEKFCAGLGKKKVIAAVGHDPHLSSLVTWLLAGQREPRIRLGKGGACLLDFESEPRRDSGTLNWLLTPRQLVARGR
jgi:phosphohistidine phosphatase